MEKHMSMSVTKQGISFQMGKLSQNTLEVYTLSFVYCYFDNIFVKYLFFVDYLLKTLWINFLSAILPLQYQHLSKGGSDVQRSD